MSERRESLHNLIQAKLGPRKTGFPVSQDSIGSGLSYLGIQFWLWPSGLGKRYVNFLSLTVTTTTKAISLLTSTVGENRMGHLPTLGPPHSDVHLHNIFL